MAFAVNLERLYDEHAPALFAFLINLTRNENDAVDLLQEVFCKIAQRPALLDGVKELRGFLLRKAHNLAIDFMRRNSSRERKHESLGAEQHCVFAPCADPDTQSFRQALSLALEELPSDQRAIVHLKLWEGFTFEAIAKALEISPNTAASRYRYGLDKLRERLRPLYDEIK